MQTVRTKRAGWAALLIAAGVGLYLMATVFVGTGAAKTQASLAKNMVVNVGAAAFVPENSGCVDYNHDGYSGLLQDFDDCEYEAHADLPDGFTIAQITAFYDDTDDNASFHFEANNDSGGHTDLATGSLDDCSSNGCATTFTVGTAVNNSKIHYGIHLEADSDFILYRFRIKLTPIPS